MSKPTVLTLRVPNDLKIRITELANQQGVSLNQLAMYMLATKVTELETKSFFEEIAGERSSEQIRAEFDAVMKIVKKRPQPADIPQWDLMPEES